MKKILFFISSDEIIIWHLFSYKINLNGKKKPKTKQPKANPEPWQKHPNNLHKG